MLAVQSLVYAVPILCLVLWERLLPEPARARHIVTCVKLFAVTVVLGALSAYGSLLTCDGYGQSFFSPMWQWTSYLPMVGIAINIPLYVLTFSLGRAYSTREDMPAADAAHLDQNMS
ncbi:hypothetical protein [Mesorhizobium captivum]|uniref:hypothetical protein n=1 Tax=Mesorhizobium captivum TaxID=3072319 RepID=UPI002A23B3BC|nr:hypothetical protein [Mesorhizobium sp. VK3C]MDX8448839.1 hypothetical protein [Mesorhizobium sp. VK3C]